MDSIADHYAAKRKMPPSVLKPARSVSSSTVGEPATTGKRVKFSSPARGEIEERNEKRRQLELAKARRKAGGQAPSSAGKNKLSTFGSRIVRGAARALGAGQPVEEQAPASASLGIGAPKGVLRTGATPVVRRTISTTDHDASTASPSKPVRFSAVRCQTSS